jgi:hypothetical protein
VKKKRVIFKEIVLVLVLGLVLICFFSVKTVNAQAGQTALNPSDDTCVNSDASSSNYGGEEYLQIWNYQYAVLGQSYKSESIVWLKFNLSSVPSGALIDEATLRLYTSLVEETFNVTACYCPNNSWTELGITWDNMPTIGLIPVDSVLVGTAYQWYDWNVSLAAKYALDTNLTAVTIELVEPNAHSSSSMLWFYSKEAPAYAPLTPFTPNLTVHWVSVVPEFPIFFALPFFMIATLTAVVVYKKTMPYKYYRIRTRCGVACSKKSLAS